MRRSERLDRDVECLRAFRVALNDFAANTTDPSRRAAADRASGPAAAIADREKFVLQDPLGANITPANPFLVWDQAFISQNVYGLLPDMVRSSTDTLIGMLEFERDRARDLERGLAGLAGRFVRFPSEVRESAGLARGSAGGKAAFGFGVFLQGVAVVVVGGIILAVILTIF
jgi:hypothetical protein